MMSLMSATMASEDDVTCPVALSKDWTRSISKKSITARFSDR